MRLRTAADRMQKIFTLREAQALVPKLEQLVRTAVKAKAEAEEVDEKLQGLAACITMAGGMEIDPGAVAAMKVHKMNAFHALQHSVEEIQETGCLLKDLDEGLLDFPAILGGHEVYLCWKLGEERIEYWHRIEDGFAGRKRIEREFGESGLPPSRPN
jgi:hypothetical protein